MFNTYFQRLLFLSRRTCFNRLFALAATVSNFPPPHNTCRPPVVEQPASLRHGNGPTQTVRALVALGFAAGAQYGALLASKDKFNDDCLC